MNLLSRFFNRYPALLYAIAATIGILAALYHWLYIFLLLAIPYRKRITLTLAIASAAITLARIQLPSGETEGEGYFSITSIARNQSHFGSGWRYSGTLVHFTQGASIPVTINLPDHISRPPAICDYYVKGTLIPAYGHHYTLKTSLTDPWIPVKNSFSFAEWRYKAKRWLKKKIKSNLTYLDSASFLTGIAIGEFDDPMLQYDFSRFGLQHIMAISGFHFSLITAFLTFMLRLVFNQRAVAISIIILMSAYFLFLGPGPSVLRAYFTIIIALMSSLIHRTTSGINALGFATFFLLLYDPLLITTIGFPFSVLTTASILLFYPRFDALLKNIFPQRFLSDATSFSGIEQHSYYILHLVRQSTALTLAVNIIAIPLTLFFFGKFPALSLIYNLFFPFLVSISMMLLLAALTLPFLASFLFSVNDYFTHYTLLLTSNLPTFFDLNFHAHSLNSFMLIIILFGLLYAAIAKPVEEKLLIRQYI